MINNKFIIKIYFLKYLVQEIEKTGKDGGYSPPVRAEPEKKWIARNIFNFLTSSNYQALSNNFSRSEENCDHKIYQYFLFNTN